MERGVYFDGWYRDEHCFHPSLPMRRLQMIEDLERYRATVLVWAALGGGVISLPYLEREAFGPVEPRLRFYGYMNDSEFIGACAKRGIKVFGIVFEVQGWEFPAEISADGRNLLGLNIAGETGCQGWYGLREFSGDAYPKLFGRTWRDYFPDGLRNSQDQEVRDLWEECAARDFYGRACHAAWVEVKDRPHICYQMCRNNPVWRAYLKKIIEIQIEAGVYGVELDECELPVTSIRYGGCFCKDCREQFRAFLEREQGGNRLEGELRDADLSTFDYGRYLKERNADYAKVKDVPYFREYWRFQMEATKKYFAELTGHIRAYGAAKGREVAVSGNFFHLLPQYMPLESEVDIITTEMRQTLYRQANWYRYAAGFAAGRPIVVVENPYGGVVPELLEELKHGRGYDLLRLLLLEAAAFGCNMAVPYGGWMGNTIRDAFYPPTDVTAEVQDFLAERSELFSPDSGAELLVLYGYESYYWRELGRNYSTSVLDDTEGILSYSIASEEDTTQEPLPFWELTAALSDRLVPYDVHILGDGGLVRDTLTRELLARYRAVVLPDLFSLTPEQLSLLNRYAADGGKVIVYGRLAENLLPASVKAFLDGTGVRRYTGAARAGDEEFFNSLAAEMGGLQVKANRTNRLGLGTHRVQDGLLLHIVNYHYRRDRDAIVPLDALNLQIRTAFPPSRISAFSHDGKRMEIEWTYAKPWVSLYLKNLPLYTVVELKEGRQAAV